MIEKEQEWATAWAGNAEACTPGSDSRIAEQVMDAQNRGEQLIVRPAAGEILRTVGLETARSDGTAQLYCWDLVLLEIKRAGSIETLPMVTYAFGYPKIGHIFNRGTSRGQFVSIMNTPSAGAYRLGPKAHPNDGVVDVAHGRLPLRQLVVARKRARSGNHLPHPAIRTRRSAQVAFDRPIQVHLIVDGQRQGSVEMLSVRVEPDAFSVVA